MKKVAKKIDEKMQACLEALNDDELLADRLRQTQEVLVQIKELYHAEIERANKAQAEVEALKEQIKALKDENATLKMHEDEKTEFFDCMIRGLMHGKQ